MRNQDLPSAAGRLAWIDCCRGVAALLVVLHHAQFFVAKPQCFGVDPLQSLFRCGCRGVDFFFVLSGFIITYAHWPDLGQAGAGRIPAYFAKRFLRIYPLLWVVGVPCILVNLLAASPDMPAAGFARWQVVVGSLSLAPTDWAPIPVVVWTLRHEVLFYAMFAIVLWRPRLGFGALAAWGGLCVGHAAGCFASNFLSDYLLSPYNLEFLLGVCCGCFLRARSVRYPLACALAGMVFFALAGAGFEPIVSTRRWITNPTTVWQAAEFGLASALVLLGLAEVDLRGRAAPPRWFVLLGAASYAIYLSHFGALSMACKILKPASGYLSITPGAALFAAALAATAMGIVLHLYVEKPLLGFLRERFLQAKPAHGAALTGRSLGAWRLLMAGSGGQADAARPPQDAFVADAAASTSAPAIPAPAITIPS